MKKCNKLILLGTILTTILVGQIPEIPQFFMNQNDSLLYIEYQNDNLYLPIIINNATGLHSAQIKVEYNSDVVIVTELVEDPDDILSSGFTFDSNYSETGTILLSISTSSSDTFTGSGIIAKIKLNSTGKAGAYSAFRFVDATINNIQKKDYAIHGSVDIVLSINELKITGKDASNIGADHTVTLGMCENCSDDWKYGEDEYDYPNGSEEYTNIHFYHPEWNGQVDENENTCNQITFASDNRSQQHVYEADSLGIGGSTGGELSADIPIELSWDSDLLASEYMYIFVGDDDGIDMQSQNNITISQNALYLNENNQPNIWIKIGVYLEGCMDTGACNYSAFATIDNSTCWYPSVCSDCNGGCTCQVDCDGECGGSTIYDACGVCGGDGSTCCDNSCTGQTPNCNGEGTCICNVGQDCLGICGGSTFEDMCGNCNINSSDDCEQDCFGIWGGASVVDACEICGGYITDEEQCGAECNATGEHLNQYGLDCAGDCGGNAVEDVCGVCGKDGKTCCDNSCTGQTPDCDGEGTCICNIGQDCLGVCGGSNDLDLCGECYDGGQVTSQTAGDCVQDCAGNWDGDALEDNCGICGGDCFGDVGTECDNYNCDGDCVLEGEGLDENGLDCMGVCGGQIFPNYECSYCIETVCNPSDCLDTCIESPLIIDNMPLPNEFGINKIYPNPFNPQSTIEYQVARSGNIKLEIYNIRGQKINELKNEYVLPGHYRVSWNGSLHPSGIYFVILHSHQSIIRKKMILLK